MYDSLGRILARLLLGESLFFSVVSRFIRIIKTPMLEEILHFVEVLKQFSKLFYLNQAIPLVIYSNLLTICSRFTKNL
jgi:hypothetical protein